MRTQLKTIAWLFALAGAASLSLHCQGSGELVVTATSDMSLPKDIDSVQLVVITRGQTQFSNKYQVGDGQLLIPATMGLLPGADPTQPVTIRVIAWKGSQPVVLREAVTTVPVDRVANLRLPIEGLSAGSATTNGQVDPTTGDLQVDNACGDGMTAVQGVCVDSTVDVTALPDYDPAEVFGGGSGDGDGACFDTAACMAGAQPLAVSPADCSFALPSGVTPENVNFALASGSGGIGICVGNPSDLTSSQGPCYLVIDSDPSEGWSGTQPQQGPLVPADAGMVDASVPPPDSGAPDSGAGGADAGCDGCTGPRYYFPAAVCAQLTSGRFNQLVYSTACAAKTSATPACGPWSSVGAAPVDAGGGHADGGVVRDGGSIGADGGTGCGLPMTQCGPVCVNLLYDPDNCGACGNGCGGGSCQNGTCVGGSGDAGFADASASPCFSPNQWCGPVCTNVQFDPNNCGTCGTVCSGGESCLLGICKLPPLDAGTD